MGTNEKIILPPPPNVPLEAKVAAMNTWIEEHKLVQGDHENRFERLNKRIQTLEMYVMFGSVTIALIGFILSSMF